MSALNNINFRQSDDLSQPYLDLDLPELESGLIGEPVVRGVVLNDRVIAASSRTWSDHARDVCQALWNSRIVRHIALATGVALAIFYFATPPGWFTLGIGALAGIVAGMTFLATMAIHYHAEKYTKSETLSFELSAIPRLFVNDHDEILPGLALGALPNRLSLPFGTSHWETLKQQGYGAFVSVNGDWERKPRGPSFPYEKRDCEACGIEYLPITSADHKPLSLQDMNAAADFIDRQRNAGKKVYVHCRAGKGRSAMAIAAYLIKHKNYTVQEAQELIKAGRPKSSIRKKTKTLERFQISVAKPVPEPAQLRSLLQRLRSAFL